MCRVYNIFFRINLINKLAFKLAFSSIGGGEKKRGRNLAALFMQTLSFIRNVDIEEVLESSRI